MINYKKLEQYYKGKKVLVTGHTGFKGTYLTVLLSLLGAKVYGYSLPAPTDPSLFEMVYGAGSSRRSALGLCSKDAAARDLSVRIEESTIGDIRDFEKLRKFYDRIKPDAVIHMAAQPIVRESYRIPRETYETNVMGTVNVLECVRLDGRAKDPETVISVLNVTTDKVYLNEEKSVDGFREDDKLDGFDPYSNSKSCSELVTHSYRNSFFPEGGAVRISTARAGNVIGGGDFAKDRIIPDCTRAFLSGTPVEVRNPMSVRPFQHVLEPLFVYLAIVAGEASDPGKAGYYNVGPDIGDCLTTGELCDLFTKYARGFTWIDRSEPGAPHEAGLLRLDNRLIKETFGWESVWPVTEAVKACAEFAAALSLGEREAVQSILSGILAYKEALDV